MQFNDTTDGLYPNNLPQADKDKPLSSLSGILRIGDEGVSITASNAPFSAAGQESAAAASPESSGSRPPP